MFMTEDTSLPKLLKNSPTLLTTFGSTTVSSVPEYRKTLSPSRPASGSISPSLAKPVAKASSSDYRKQRIRAKHKKKKQKNKQPTVMIKSGSFIQDDRAIAMLFSAQ
jgi:hypothetical protein